MRFDRRGISPVIATVIIVSFAIAIAVAVAFWMTGITGLFTRYERVEITNCYADWDSTYNCWLVVIQLRNSGSDDATIDEIFINGRPHAAITGLYDEYIWYFNGKTTVTLDVSDNTITIQDTDPNLSFSPFDFDNGIPLKAGEEMTIVIIMPGPGFSQVFTGSITIQNDASTPDTETVSSPSEIDFKHGASIEIKLHTAAGKEYPKTVVLP